MEIEVKGRVSEMCFTVGGTFSPMAINGNVVRCSLHYDLIKQDLSRHSASWALALDRVSPEELECRCMSANAEPSMPSLDEVSL